MLIRSAPKRCTRCENILNPDEIEQKWCDKCRANKRNENDRHKKNQASRKQAMSLFGIRRKNDDV